MKIWRPNLGNTHTNSFSMYIQNMQEENIPPAVLMLKPDYKDVYPHLHNKVLLIYNSVLVEGKMFIKYEGLYYPFIYFSYTVMNVN